MSPFRTVQETLTSPLGSADVRVYLVLFDSQRLDQEFDSDTGCSQSRDFVGTPLRKDTGGTTKRELGRRIENSPLRVKRSHAIGDLAGFHLVSRACRELSHYAEFVSANHGLSPLNWPSRDKADTVDREHCDGRIDAEGRLFLE